MNRFLIVEDDRALCDGIVLALRSERDAFVQCHSLAQARRELAGAPFALVILDVNLEDGNGLDLLREIKSCSETPVILLTANDLETDIVTGLELGAADYITKPFSLMVLRARVNTQLRKAQKTAALTLGPFRFDFEAMKFFKNETSVELSKTEQKLLRLLVESRGQTLSREVLVDRLWSDGADFVDENALSVTVRRLRAKLEDEPSKPQHIRTVYGIGYTWTVT